MQTSKKIVTTQVELSALDDNCVEPICRWRNDFALSALMTAAPIPTSRQQVAAWYASTQADRNQIILGIYNAEPKELIGLFRLMFIDWISGVAELGIYIGDKEFRNGGRGRQGLIQGLDYAFDSLNLRKIWLRVVSSNQSAIKLYKSLSFGEEGLLKEHFYADGKYHDLIVMGLHRENYTST